MKNLSLVLLFTGFVFLSVGSTPAQLLRRNVCQKVMGPEKALFNGEDLSGWTTVPGEPITGWEVVDGVLHRCENGKDIVTDRNYHEFILDFKWKIAKGGNSGVKYRFTKFKTSNLGCEFQILDDPNSPGEGTLPKHRVGDLYDIFSAADNKELLPYDQYNHGRIIVNGRNIQHWLNGKQILNIQIDSPQWKEGFAKSKFHEYPGFGKLPGKILLQDHGDEVWFKEITIREIKTVSVKKRGIFSQIVRQRQR